VNERFATNNCRLGGETRGSNAVNLRIFRVFLTVCSVVMQIRSIVSCHFPAITVTDAL